MDADIVIGVPDSGIDAALGYAKESGILFGVGFVKNKYIGRSFIEPDGASRRDTVNIKLNVIKSNIEGKRVVMVDDSIVRGTTSEKIVRLLREAGAREVHMRVSAPPFRFPCYFGTDIDSQENLIACKYKSVKEIAKSIGVDSLGYLELSDVHHLAETSGCDFCDGCFSGKRYINQCLGTNNSFCAPAFFLLYKKLFSYKAKKGFNCPCEISDLWSETHMGIT